MNAKSLGLSPGVEPMVPWEYIYKHLNDVIPATFEMKADGVKYNIKAKNPATLGEVMRANKGGFNREPKTHSRTGVQPVRL